MTQVSGCFINDVSKFMSKTKTLKKKTVPRSLGTMDTDVKKVIDSFKKTRPYTTNLSDVDSFAGIDRKEIEETFSIGSKTLTRDATVNELILSELRHANGTLTAIWELLKNGIGVFEIDGK